MHYIYTYIYIYIYIYIISDAPPPPTPFNQGTPAISPNHASVLASDNQNGYTSDISTQNSRIASEIDTPLCLGLFRCIYPPPLLRPPRGLGRGVGAEIPDCAGVPRGAYALPVSLQSFGR
jgi:hypothetical protein